MTSPCVNTVVFGGGLLTLEWGPFGAPSEPVNFTLDAVTSGWVSIGWGGSVHNGVDSLFGYVSGGVTVLVDGSLKYPSYPAHQTIPDEVANIHSFVGSEVDGRTRIAFSRSPRTNDPTDADLTSGPIVFHWALAEDDAPSSKHYAAVMQRSRINFAAPGCARVCAPAPR